MLACDGPAQIVFRDSKLDSNSGIRVERQTEDIIVESTIKRANGYDGTNCDS